MAMPIHKRNHNNSKEKKILWPVKTSTANRSRGRERVMKALPLKEELFILKHPSMHRITRNLPSYRNNGICSSSESCKPKKNTTGIFAASTK